MVSNIREDRVVQDEENATTSSVLEDNTSFLDDETQDSILHLLRSQLYICKEGKEWEERGDVLVDFVKHKESGTVTLIMRHYPSLDLIAKHPLTPTMELEEYAGRHNSCMWPAIDYQDGESKKQLFRIDFLSAEDWEAFIRKFKDVTETLSKKEEREDGDAAAGFLEK